MQTNWFLLTKLFKNLLQNYSTELLDVGYKSPLGTIQSIEKFGVFVMFSTDFKCFSSFHT